MILYKKLRKINYENLKFISNKLKSFKCFVFYGTLLGLTRENNILKYDDDVDFLIDIKFKEQVLNKFKKSNLFKINKNVSNKYFVQLVRNEKNLKTFVDLYFYIYPQKKNYIIEKHNFLSAINLESHSLFIPKKILFPLKRYTKYKDIYFPKRREGVCKYLYGPDWRKPLTKNSGYRMEIINHKPKLIKRSFLGKITRYIKNSFTKNFLKN